jgi:hypothetical protein
MAGQAKRRGDYETRKAAAIARNDALAAQINTLPELSPVRRASRRMPMQRLAVALLAAGALTSMPREK